MKKRVFFAVLALFSFAAFFSCSNAAGGSDSESSKPSSASASKKPGYVTLTGTVSVSGTVPKILSDNYDSSSDNDGVSRSAQPGINTSGDGATMEYFARATSGNLVSEGAFGSGADAKKFGLELQAGIEWTIVVGVREKSTSKPISARTVYLSSTWKVTPDPAAPTISHNFVPVPNTSGGTGSIALKINYSPSLYEVKLKFVDGPDGFADLNDEDWTYDPADGGRIYKMSSIPSGKYELCLDFKDTASQVLVYSTIQSVTVADGMITDSWVADSSSSAVSPISASGEFKFDSSAGGNAQALMAAFLGTNLFVGKVSDDCDAPADTNSGNYLSPLKTVTGAVKKIGQAGSGGADYVIRVSGEVEGTNSASPAVIQAISTSNAKSLTIIGTSGDGTDCIKSISSQAPAVNISTNVPITFKKIKIMGSKSSAGPGEAINAFGGSKVTIDEGSLITGGKIGVNVTGDSTKVTMKGGSISGNDADVYLESGKVLTVDCNLSDVADKGIVVSLQSWTRGTQFIEAGEHLSAITEDIVKKFDFTKTGWDTPIDASNKKATIDADIYVAANGVDKDSENIENTIGNKNYPFASIKQASKYLDASHGTIYVSGSVSGAQEIPSSVASTCTAIKLTGLNPLPTSGTNAYVPSDEINAGGAAGAGTALTVATSVPVTIENLKITGGRSGTNYTGGGISVNAGSVTLSDGAWVSGNTAGGTVGCGGGVYVASVAKLFMKGKALVGNKTVSSAPSTYTGGANNLTAGEGGGIHNRGSVYIGCNESGVAATGYALDDGYGVRGNWSNQEGGGIANYGTLKIASGEIACNMANNHSDGAIGKGGGVYHDGSALVISGGSIYANAATGGGALYIKGSGAVMTGGTIGGDTDAKGNVARRGAGQADGGAITILDGKSFEMSGGTISHNTAKTCGGAVCNYGTFTMSGGLISANTASGTNPLTSSSSYGGAVYNYGTFNLSGAAYIPAGAGTTASPLNDVFLKDGKTVTVAGTLSPTTTGAAGGTAASVSVGALTLSSWSRGTKFLSATSTNASSLVAAKSKIALSKDPTGWTKSDDSTTSSAATRYAWITSPIYVASSGTIDTTRKVCSAAPTSGNNGTKTSPYATISAALAASDLPKADNTITIDGTLSAQTIPSGVTLPTGVTAVTLQGYKAEDDTTSAATINGGGTASALSISKSATYTIKDLKITNGKTTSGGGIYLGAGTVNLDSGAKVYNNKVTSSGAGVYVVNGASLNIKSGSEIYSNSAYSGYINGGGVCNLGTVDMTGGSIYSNSANNGGGIYSSGTLYVRGSALIGNKTETTATGSTAGTYCSNSAIASGGGIYNSGTLYFGCNTSGTKDADSGYALDSGYGVRRNYANDGGGIYNTGTFKSGSGSISYNYAPNSAGGLYAGGSTNNMGGLGVSYNNTGKNGAGVYVASSKSAEVTAQSGVNHNTATASSGSSDVCGGGIYVAGTLTTTETLNANWNSASITGGSGKAYGGCVYIASGGKFVYSKGQLGGTSQSNTVSNTVSGSTDKAYGGSVYQGGTFEVSANGYIPKGSLKSDDVYLPSEKYITVTDVISGNSESSQMTITPATWKRGTQVLAKGGDLSYTNFKNQIVKFKGSETDWLAVYNSYVGKLYTSYKIYVSQSGYDDDKNGLGTSAKPYKTISKAVGECWTTGSAFTVYVSGTIKGAHTIGGTDVTINAKSLTLEGTGTSPTIDAEKTAGIRPLTINTSLGVTIKNLTITNGNVTPNYGGGIYVEGGCALTLDDGASVLSNKASSGGGGVYVDTGSTLIMKSGSTINKNVGSGDGGGVYNKGKVLMSGTARIGANGTSKPGTSSTSPTGNSGLRGGGIYNAGTVCLGYTAWTDETTNTPKKLEGGVTQNYASSASGGIYVDTAAKVYMKTGNISYNRANNGGGMTNATGTVKLLGGKMESNWADSNKSGAIWQSGDLYLGGDVYIPYGGSLGLNDLYLNDKSVLLNTDIAPPEDCTNGVIATIYPKTYASMGVVGQNYAYASCLAVVPQSSQAWTINTSNGYLKTANAITSSNISSVVSGLSSGTTKEFVADSTFDNDSLAALKTQLNALSSDNTAKIKLDLSQSSVTSIWETGIITSRVTSLKIPNKLKSGIWQGLWNATGLTEILVSPANTYYCSESGILYRHDAEGNKIALTIYPAAKTGSTYTLPTTVTYLDGACFLNNQNLTTISGLTQIKGFSTYGHQFNGCQKLTSTIDLSSATDNTVLDHTTIGYCPKITTVWLPNTITKICNYNFYSCPELTAVHFKSTVPPTLEVSSGKIFYNVNSNLKVYVPTNAAKTSYANSDDFRDSSKNALISGGSASGWTSRLYVD